MDYAPFELAKTFEVYLGNPHDPANEFSFARCAELDALELFPDVICARLEDWGLQRYYVPEQFGGALRDFEQPMQLMRMLARRDLTVAIGHGKTFLGGVCAWVNAEPEQARQLATLVLNGAVVSWALTEREHGSDLLGNEVFAEVNANGYCINGEKWLINNATRGALISLLARTRMEGGPRGFDMLLIDKRTLDQNSFRYLPKEPTHGIRGADISGIAFQNASVPNSAMIGQRGTGLETVLKGLQLTRTLCASLSLGAGDHALRLAVRFASERKLYDRTLIDLPYAQRTLLDAYTDQLLAEAVTLVGTRSIQALTNEMSVTSAVVKYLVPSRTEAMLDALAGLLGARSFLVDVYADGMFQKVLRDNRIVSLFDGNTLVNLNVVINEFQSLARRYRKDCERASTDLVFDLTAPLPAFDRKELSLISRQGCSVLNTLPAMLKQLTQLASQRDELRCVLKLTQQIAIMIDAVHRQMAEQVPVRTYVPAEYFDLAKRYALCYAAAASLGLWLGTIAHIGANVTEPIWRDGLWLRAALVRILKALGECVSPDEQADEALLSLLLRQQTEGLLFSLLPCELAESRGKA